MIQYQKETYVHNFIRLRRNRKNEVIFQNCGRDVTMMASSTQDLFLNFGVTITFGLRVR